MPKISIIIPVYNVEKYIHRCLDSILRQTISDIEIILIDDGSTDKCPQICDEYQKIDSRIKVVHKENEGLGLARNSGLNISSGEYVAFVDSDDFVDIDIFEKMYEKAVSFDCDAVLQGNKLFNNGKISQKNSCKRNILYENENIILEMLPSIIGSDFRGNDYIGMSVWRGLYRRKVIEDNNIRFFSERDYISEDILFDILFYSKAKKVFVSDLFGYYYCINPGSLTHSSKPQKYLLNDSSHKKIKELLSEINASTESYKRLDYTYIFNMKACINNEVNAISVLGKRRTKEIVSEIVSSQELANTLKTFDTKKMPIHKKIYCYFLKRKCVNLLILYTKLQKGVMK